MGSQKARFFKVKALYVYLVAFTFFMSQETLQGQIIINEITGSGQIEFKNTGTEPVDLSTYWLYSFPQLLPLNSFDILCDSTLLGPGQILALDTFPINPADGELALFKTNVFNIAGFLDDYVEWGSHGHFNARLAKQAGIWTNGDFVFPFSANEGIEYDGMGDFSTDWELAAASSICEENIINDDDCLAAGGEIVSANSLDICADGIPNLINAFVTGQQGDTTKWIVTNQNNVILDNDASLPYNFDQQGPGVCFLRAITYNGTISGNSIGSNLNQISGCFQLSNILEVTKEIPNGGLVITQDGEVNVTACRDNLQIDMNFLTTTERLDYWFIVTEADETIIFGQDARDNSIVDLSSSTLTQCRIYGVAGEDLPPPPPGTALFSYINQPCRAVSGNFVTITKEENVSVGGRIMTTDVTNFCVSDNITPVNVNRDTTVVAENLSWVITNELDSIIALPEAPPFTFDTLGVSVSKIYSISFQDGLEGLEVGSDLTDLQGCYDLSDSIIVAIQVPNGGMVLDSDGNDMLTLCGGNVRFQLMANDFSNQLPYYYLITGAQDTIVEIVEALPGNTPIDLSDESAGICRIYGWAQTGPLNPQIGQTVNELSGDCSDLSDNFFTLVKEENPFNGGLIATSSPTSICLDDNPDFVNVFINGAVGDSSRWLITDPQQNILDIDQEPPFDFSNAPIGICHIYHLSYGDDLRGLSVGANILDFENCYGLSNSIEISRDSLDGGLIMGRDTSNTFTTCAGGSFVTLTHETRSTLLAYDYIVVSADNLIKVVLDPAEGPIYDLSQLGVGSYRIFGWAHDAAEVAVIDNPLLSLEDGFCQALSSNFVQLEILPNPHRGGLLTSDNDRTICVDGIEDFIDLELFDNEGIVRIAYLITDEHLNILDIPSNDPPFDLDDGHPGTVLIWNIAHNGAINNFEIGNNVADIVGCFDLSNPLIFEKVKPDGGRVSSVNGETALTFCSGNINFEVQFTTSTPGLDYYYVLTDEAGIITQVSDANESNLISINEGSEGLCRLYGWSFDGAPPMLEGTSIVALNDLACSAISENFIEIEKTGNANNGGMLTASNLDINCSDGLPDPIEVVLSGAFGSNQAWIITDSDGDILALPFAPPFNLDPAGGGVFFIYSISYETGLTGLNVFNNIDDLQGCYDLSNALQVVNQQAEGGVISSNDNLTVCAGDMDATINIDVAGAIGVNSRYLLTSVDGTIQSISENGSFDFSSSGAGICLAWHLSYVDIMGLEVGGSIGDFEGCFDLSNSLTIQKIEANSGQISLANGEQEASLCTANAVFQVQSVQPSAGFHYKYLIADAINNIIDVVESPTGQIDLSNTGTGVCRIFGWTALEGSPDPTPGTKVFELNEGCSDITNNFISISKLMPDGATVASSEGASVFICIDNEADPVRMFNTSNVNALDYVYLVTDLNGNVLSVVNGDFVDLNNAGAGVSRVYGYSHDANNAPSVGDNINVLNASRCGSVSTNFISITRQAADGGRIISDQGDIITICLDNEPDQVLFTPNTSATSLDYTFVITDENNNILEFTDDRIIDFNVGPEGEVRIYGWSHNNRSVPIIGQDIASLEEVSCGDLTSNFIRVVKVSTGSPCTVNTYELADFDWKIFPNPVKDVLYIENVGLHQIDRLTLYSTNGSILHIEERLPQGTYSVDLDHLGPGSYILQLESQGKSAFSKVVIIR
jgi:hypothetical protein